MTDQTETPETIKVGTRIYYHGDMANVPHFGTIIEITGDEWGTFYEIKTDARSHAGPSYTYKINSAHVSLVYNGNGLTRFVTEAAYNDYREQNIAEFKAAHALIQEGA